MFRFLKKRFRACDMFVKKDAFDQNACKCTMIKLYNLKYQLLELFI